MNFTVALAMYPQVNTLERNLKAERSALERLAAWAYQFSSTIVLGDIAPAFRKARHSLLWIEIGASLKLFGGLRPLLARIDQELAELNYTYRLGVGPTLEGAALLARAGIRIAIMTTERFSARIRNLPIRYLALTDETFRHLHIAGIRTIGLLLELPRDALAKRFGPQTSDYLARLVGTAPDPRPTFELPRHYDAHFAFDFELQSTEALLFPLQRMLREFCGYLRGLDVCVQHFDLILEHHGAAATSLRLGLSRPERSAEKFLTLVREQLDRITIPAPTVGLRLSARHFVEPSAQQSDFFSRALQNSEEFAHTFDRLVARLGVEHVHWIQCVADHRPEACWRKSHAADAQRATLAFPERPLWLLPQPKLLQRSHLIQVISGPERIESGWWDGGDVRRDYYLVATRDGQRAWAFRPAGNADAPLMLQGWFA